MSEIRSFDPEAVQAALEDRRIVLIDVREPAEYANERIAGSVLSPLSSLDPIALPRADGRDIVLHCGSGVRSEKALKMCERAGVKIAGHIAGGMMKWKSAGLPVESADGKKGLSVSQAVMVTASTIVLGSMALSLAFNPLWLALGAAASAMMIQAAFTGFCPAGKVFTALGFRPG